MNKKEYMKPALRIVRIEHQGIICTSVNNVAGGTLKYGGGGSGPSRSRSFDDWDEEEE